jgi:hypothetical protein
LEALAYPSPLISIQRKFQASRTTRSSKRAKLVEFDSSGTSERQATRVNRDTTNWVRPHNQLVAGAATSRWWCFKMAIQHTSQLLNRTDLPPTRVGKEYRQSAISH